MTNGKDISGQAQEERVEHLGKEGGMGTMLGPPLCVLPRGTPK